MVFQSFYIPGSNADVEDGADVFMMAEASQIIKPSRQKLYFLHHPLAPGRRSPSPMTRGPNDRDESFLCTMSFMVSRAPINGATKLQYHVVNRGALDGDVMLIRWPCTIFFGGVYSWVP